MKTTETELEDRGVAIATLVKQKNAIGQEIEKSKKRIAELEVSIKILHKYQQYRESDESGGENDGSGGESSGSNGSDGVSEVSEVSEVSDGKRWGEQRQHYLLKKERAQRKSAQPTQPTPIPTTAEIRKAVVDAIPTNGEPFSFPVVRKKILELCPGASEARMRYAFDKRIKGNCAPSRNRKGATKKLRWKIKR